MRVKGDKHVSVDLRLHRGIFCALLVLIGLGMLLLNVHTPLMMDDYDYSFSWHTGERLSGVGDIIASQAAHYMIWGGRSVVHFLAQLFLLLGKPVFNAANAIMYVLLLVEIGVLARRRSGSWNPLPLLMAHVLLFFGVSFFGVVFLWLDGACNYLWGTVLALLPLVIAKSEREEGWFAAGFSRGWLALPLCFLAGWTNENTGCGVLAAVGMLLIWDMFKSRKIRAWRVAAIVLQAAGAALMLLAPGNFARAAEEASRPLIMELAYRFAVVSYCLLRYTGAALIPCAFVLLIAYKKRLPVNMEWLCVLLGCAGLCAYALVGSPQISDRSFMAVFVLLTAVALSAADSAELKDTPALRAVCCALVIVSVAGGVWAFGRVSAHEEAWVAQTERICQAAESGEKAVSVSSVLSDSRYTMPVILQKDAALWPNSTLGKYYGIEVFGE